MASSRARSRIIAARRSACVLEQSNCRALAVWAGPSALACEFASPTDPPDFAPVVQSFSWQHATSAARSRVVEVASRCPGMSGRSAAIPGAPRHHFRRRGRPPARKGHQRQSGRREACWLREARGDDRHAGPGSQSGVGLLARVHSSVEADNRNPRGPRLTLSRHAHVSVSGSA